MFGENKVRQMVRKVVYRTLGIQPADEALPARRPVVGELDLINLPGGSVFQAPPGAMITPLARQLALDRRIQIFEQAAAATDHRPTAAAQQPQAATRPTSGVAADRVIALAADHGGFVLKEQLKSFLQSQGYQLIDCGTNSDSAVDYPDFAFAAAQLVGQGKAWRAILVDGAGIGSCMTANKLPGVRAAMCYDLPTAINSRQHNDANVLTLGAGMITPELAVQISKTWLETDFGGGRHARRVDKIKKIEQRFLR